MGMLAVLPGSCVGQGGDAIAAISAALRSQDFPEAEKLSKAALQQSPRNIRLLTLRGIAYSGEKRPELALASFEDALKLSPDFLPALEGAAQVAYLQGGNAAKPFLLRILTEQPAEPTANAMLAVIDYKARDCEGAVEHFQAAQALLPSQPDSLVEYGTCLATLNRMTDALPVLQQAVDVAPDDQVARYNLAVAQSNLSQVDDALLTLAPLLNAASPPEDVLTLAADMYESKNETQRAVDLLRQAVLANPKDKEAYLQFAYLSYKHSSVQVGVDMLNVGLTQLPNEAELYLARGVLLSQSSNSPKAMEDFDTAMRLDPKLSFASDAAGIARSQVHDDAAALATFRTTAKQHPNDGLTQYLLAEALSQAAPAPGTPAFAEAVGAAKRSIALDPDRLEAHDLLASLYLRAEQMDLSLQQSEEALRVDPNDEEALYHEIMALRKGGRKAEVPALVQRMMKVRESKAAEAKTKLYRLVEAPSASGDAPQR